MQMSKSEYVLNPVSELPIRLSFSNHVMTESVTSCSSLNIGGASFEGSEVVVRDLREGRAGTLQKH